MNADLIRRAVSPWLIALNLVLAAACLLALLGRWHWLADLFSHFVPHYFAAGGILSLALLLTRRYGWAALALAIGLWNGWLLSPYLLPERPAQSAGAHSIELLQFNVSRDNPAPLATIGYILSLEEPPDVVMLFEITPIFATEIKRLKELYPTLAQMPRSDNFGMALLSRLPESEVEFREAGQAGVPLMVLSARIGGQGIRVYSAHPPPPLGSVLSRARNVQLQTLAREIARHDGDHVVIAGDLNTTPWSHAFPPLVNTAGLRDAQRGHGYLPTWAPPPYSRWIGIPIDHTLISAGVEAQHRRVGPWLGSDHWPVHTRLTLR
ncbi:MAG: endonuclease/exonuclease/phosphatase family protein [Gammaproteobacteria bacterium]|nr:endonuclease/exonuclease/phosphatase family protein [Gammaproteobacteria bacterium]